MNLFTSLIMYIYIYTSFFHGAFFPLDIALPPPTFFFKICIASDGPTCIALGRRFVSCNAIGAVRQPSSVGNCQFALLGRPWGREGGVG